MQTAANGADSASDTCTWVSLVYRLEMYANVPVKLLKYVQVLRNKGLPITAEEESMQTILENIQEQLTLSEQFHGKLSQLWAQLQLVKESGRKYGKPDDIEGWSNVTSEDMKSITRVSERTMMVTTGS